MLWYALAGQGFVLRAPPFSSSDALQVRAGTQVVLLVAQHLGMSAGAVLSLLKLVAAPWPPASSAAGSSACESFAIKKYGSPGTMW